MGCRFLLAYKNMLESNAPTRGECTTKHEHKASYNIEYNIPDLIDLLGMIEKRSEHRLKKLIIYLWKILYWLKIGLSLVFSMKFLSTISVCQTKFLNCLECPSLRVLECLSSQVLVKCLSHQMSECLSA